MQIFYEKNRVFLQNATFLILISNIIRPYSLKLTVALAHVPGAKIPP